MDSIITQVAKKCECDAEKLYENIVWPLGKKYGHAHDAFKLAVTYVMFMMYSSHNVRFDHLLHTVKPTLPSRD